MVKRSVFTVVEPNSALASHRDARIRNYQNIQEL
jgi:hypothetical protein